MSGPDDNSAELRTLPAIHRGGGDGQESPGQGSRERDERTVEQGFWRKARRVAGKVPFVEDAVAAYYCALDPKTPTYVRAIAMGALAYFVIPTDAIPDVIAAFGFTDDASVLSAALAAIGGHLKDRHRSKARSWLEGGKIDSGTDTAED